MPHSSSLLRNSTATASRGPKQQEPSSLILGNNPGSTHAFVDVKDRIWVKNAISFSSARGQDISLF